MVPPTWPSPETHSPRLRPHYGPIYDAAFVAIPSRQVAHQAPEARNLQHLAWSKAPVPACSQSGCLEPDGALIGHAQTGVVEHASPLPHQHRQHQPDGSVVSVSTATLKWKPFGCSV